MILWSSSLHQYWSYWNICWLKNESILIFRRNLQRVYIWSILNSWKLKIRHTMRKLKKEMRYWIHLITWISITFLHLPVFLFSGKFYTKIYWFLSTGNFKIKKENHQHCSSFNPLERKTSVCASWKPSAERSSEGSRGWSSHGMYWNLY